MGNRGKDPHFCCYNHIATDMIKKAGLDTSLQGEATAGVPREEACLTPTPDPLSSLSQESLFCRPQFPCLHDKGSSCVVSSAGVILLVAC